MSYDDCDEYDGYDDDDGFGDDDDGGDSDHFERYDEIDGCHKDHLKVIGVRGG